MVGLLERGEGDTADGRVVRLEELDRDGGV